MELPKEIPPGKYTVVADVYDKDEKKVTCLQATVEFKRGGAASWVEQFRKGNGEEWKRGL